MPHFSVPFDQNMIGMLGIKFNPVPDPDGAYSATMPVDHHTCQMSGLLCGGASLAFIDIISGMASYAVLGLDGDRYPVGQQVSANMVASAYLGQTVTATAFPVHIGRTTHVWSVVITDETGRTITQGMATNAILAAAPAPAAGTHASA